MKKVLLVVLSTFVSMFTMQINQPFDQTKHILLPQKGFYNKKKTYKGQLSYFNNSLVIKIPVNSNDLFLIRYGIESGDLLVQHNGEDLDFEHSPKKIKTDFSLELLGTFKRNAIDHNHMLCYPKDDTLDSSDAENGIMHYYDNCYITKLRTEHQGSQVITIRSRMTNILSKL